MQKLNEKSDLFEAESDLEQEEPLCKRLKFDLFVEEVLNHSKNYEKSVNKRELNPLILDCLAVKSSTSIDITADCKYSKINNKNFVSFLFK